MVGYLFYVKGWKSKILLYYFIMDIIAFQNLVKI